MTSAPRSKFHIIGDILCALAFCSPGFGVAFFGDAVAGATVLFPDDFDAGASPAWGNERGSWRTVNGQYDATYPNNDPPTYSSVTTFPNLTNFAVDVDVNYWNDGSIFLRSSLNGEATNGIVLITGGWGGTYGAFTGTE